MVLVSLFILWLVNWLVGGSNDSVFGWFIVWVVDCLVGWSYCCLVCVVC